MITTLTELPHASTVRPIILEGIRSKIPKKFNNETNLSAIKSIQVAATKKPYNAIGAAINNDMLDLLPSIISSPGAYRRIDKPIVIAIN